MKGDTSCSRPLGSLDRGTGWSALGCPRVGPAAEAGGEEGAGPPPSHSLPGAATSGPFSTPGGSESGVPSNLEVEEVSAAGLGDRHQDAASVPTQVPLSLWKALRGCNWGCKGHRGRSPTRQTSVQATHTHWGPISHALHPPGKHRWCSHWLAKACTCPRYGGDWGSSSRNHTPERQTKGEGPRKGQRDGARNTVPGSMGAGPETQSPNTTRCDPE